MKAYTRHGSLVESLGTPRVFAHDIGTLRGFSGIIQQVSGIRKYDRATAIARPEDVVFLKSAPDKEYLQWLSEVGLGSRNIVVVRGREDMSLPERIMRNGSKNDLDRLLGNTRTGATFSPYYGGRLEKRTSDYLGLFMYSNTEVSEEMDNKIGFKLNCRKLGIPVVKESIIDTSMTESEMGCAISHWLEKTGKVILRGEYGASASTIHVLDHVDNSFLKELTNRNPYRTRFLVEPFFEKLSSPSSVWFIKQDGSIVHLRTSNQILENGISHLGNEFPVRFDEEFVDRMSFRFAQFLAKKGFIGPFGLDFIETETGVFATECNPRMTGAIYPWELVYLLEQKGPVRAARSENIKLPLGCREFSVMRQLWNDVLYDGKSSEGVVIPYNVGPIRTGKITVLCTGSSRDAVMKLFTHIKSKL
ncbi:MAG: ATP-grasp domain-containing protein [Candidatus Thorarchaeota archaeon]|jgi:hypothetical protein